MKAAATKKVLTFGDFILCVYDACDEHKAGAIVWLAIHAGLVRSQAAEAGLPERNICR